MRAMTAGGCAPEAEGCADEYCPQCWADILDYLGWDDDPPNAEKRGTADGGRCRDGE